jgi:hypothetical protein
MATRERLQNYASVAIVVSLFFSSVANCQQNALRPLSALEKYQAAMRMPENDAGNAMVAVLCGLRDRDWESAILSHVSDMAELESHAHGMTDADRRVAQDEMQKRLHPPFPSANDCRKIHNGDRLEMLDQIAATGYH